MQPKFILVNEPQDLAYIKRNLKVISQQVTTGMNLSQYSRFVGETNGRILWLEVITHPVVEENEPVISVYAPRRPAANAVSSRPIPGMVSLGVLKDGEELQAALQKVKIELSIGVDMQDSKFQRKWGALYVQIADK